MTWLLLGFLLLTWFVWVIACAAESSLRKARQGIPEEERGGVSILPGFPLFPLVAWGMALVADRWVGPWGSYGMAGLHLVLGINWALSIYRNSAELRKLDGS